MRFSLIVLLAIAAPVSGAAAGVMRIAYPDAYLAGADALAVLSLGMVCFALFVIGATILSGAGRPGLSAAIAAIAVALVVAGNLGLLHLTGVGPHTLRAAATGTSLGMAFALVAVGVRGATRSSARSSRGGIGAARAGFGGGRLARRARAAEPQRAARARRAVLPAGLRSCSCCSPRASSARTTGRC